MRWYEAWAPPLIHTAALPRPSVTFVQYLLGCKINGDFGLIALYFVYEGGDYPKRGDNGTC
jgi:hypothetical protein